MKKRLFWKLLGVIAISTVTLFWLIDLIASHTEDSMSYIDQEYRNELRAYAKEAEHILETEGEDKLTDWVKNLERKENTWIAIVRPTLNTLADTDFSERYKSEFTLGRSLDWKIHLYFKENPTMDIPFTDGKTRFLIQLPQRMRPGSNLLIIDLLLQIALPCLILCLITYVLYQQVMRPLRKLEQATQAFSEGDFSARAGDTPDKQNDELTHLATTFDAMAGRISTLIVDQRQLLADLSHELRTPLTRLNIAMDCVELSLDKEHALARLRYESSNMQALIDDALTLAWFNTESPTLSLEQLDLVELLQVIMEDARFEYPEHKLLLETSEASIFIDSAQQALAAALENTIRNALSHTPKQHSVIVRIILSEQRAMIYVDDQGTGVPENHIEDIFKPFFRIQKEPSVEADNKAVSSKKSGYGLGLALAKRQILALDGTLQAMNRYDDTLTIQGLTLLITLPLSSNTLNALNH